MQHNCKGLWKDLISREEMLKLSVVLVHTVRDYYYSLFFFFAENFKNIGKVPCKTLSIIAIYLL